MIPLLGKNFLHEPSNRRVFYLKNFLYICIMKNGLLLYFVYGVLNLMILDISLTYLIVSFLEVDYIGVLLWSMILAMDLTDLITKQKNFVRYYPNFQEKWLTFL